MSTLTNRQVRLARRPETTLTREHWRFTTEAVGELPEGGVLVKTLTLSLDPAMRSWINSASTYTSPVGIAEVMRARGVGRVVASRNAAFPIGDTVYGLLGVQEYALIPQDEVHSRGLVTIDLSLGSIGQWLNVLGMSGLTAYFGLLDVGQPKKGDTVVVSGAAGAVGQTAGQLAKIKGCRVVGIAGGEAKSRWVVDELGFDACIDYKAGGDALRAGLDKHCPQGVDIYFDNVGGEILDQVLARLASKARVVISGAISQYNNANSLPVAGPRNYLNLLFKRARMEGFVVLDYVDRFPGAVAELAGYLKDGRIRSREDVVKGLDTFPESLNKLFAGQNFGKLVLQVAEAP